MTDDEYHHLACPACGKRIRVQLKNSERKVPCPRDGCSEVLTIPGKGKPPPVALLLPPPPPFIPAPLPPPAVPIAQKLPPKAPPPKKKQVEEATARIVVQRKDQFTGSLRTLTIFIDEEEAGTLKRGKMEKFPVTPGTHAIYALLGTNNFSKNYEVKLKSGQRVSFECGHEMGLVANTLTLEVVEEPFDGSVREAKRMLRAKSGTTGPVKHDGAIVLAMGIGGWCIGLIGLAAVGRGFSSLEKMKTGQMIESSSGRAMIITGMVLGGVGFLANAAAILLQCLSGNLFK